MLIIIILNQILKLVGALITNAIAIKDSIINAIGIKLITIVITTKEGIDEDAIVNVKDYLGDEKEFKQGVMQRTIMA